MRTNKEAELMANKENSWVFAYACCSEFYMPDVLHIECNDDPMLLDDDALASKEAEKAGVPLIYGLEGVPDGVYVDTDENRERISKALTLYPEYKIVGEEYNALLAV